MKVVYYGLCPGELPIWSCAKSRAVHIWVPRDCASPTLGGPGWVRQSNPVYRKHRKPHDFALRDLNALVPLLDTNRHRFKMWLRARARQLGIEKGVLNVVWRDIGPDWIHCGVFHDTRPYDRGIIADAQPPFPDLPTEITL